MPLLRWLQQAVGEFVDQVLPGVCFACHAPLARAAHSICPQCAAASSSLRIPQTEIAFFPNAGALHCFSATTFEMPVSQWIHRFKYPTPGLLGLDPGPARFLSSLILEASFAAPRADAIVPIPLHPARLRKRGFNPALLLAQNLAAAHRIPLVTNALARVRNTPTQTALKTADRIANVRGAFRAAETKTLAGDAHVWLVDDVITTGSTLNEAARELERIGIREIFGISIARTPSLVEKSLANS